MRTLRPVILAVPLLMLALPAPLASQTEEVELVPGVRVVISLAWGQVKVVGDDGSTIRMSRSTRPRSAGPTVMAEAGTPVAMTLVEDELRVEQAAKQEGGFASSFLELRVPREAPLTIKMSNGGEIFLTGTRGDVEVVNLNGSVHLEDVGGPVRVSASNGAITGSLAGSLDSGMSFASLNGEIDLTLPPDVALTARLRTDNGRVKSDFPFEVTERNTSMGNGAEVLAEINGGGTPFVATTRSGDVILRRGSQR